MTEPNLSVMPSTGRMLSSGGNDNVFSVNYRGLAPLHPGASARITKKSNSRMGVHVLRIIDAYVTTGQARGAKNRAAAAREG